MPTADPNAVFGSIITRRDVELAVVDHLVNWVPTYVAALESQAGLPTGSVPMPPDPQLSFRAGLDFNTWEQAWCPCFIATVEPEGAPERLDGEGNYVQNFLIEVAVNFVMTYDARSLGPIEEDSARQYADILGMAGCAAIVQHGGLGNWPDGRTVTIKSRLVQYPFASFPLPDRRELVRSQFSIRALVGPVLDEADGPPAPLANPYALPLDWPTVESIDVTLQGEQLALDVDSAVAGLVETQTVVGPDGQTGTVSVTG